MARGKNKSKVLRLVLMRHEVSYVIEVRHTNGEGRGAGLHMLRPSGFPSPKHGPDLARNIETIASAAYIENQSTGLLPGPCMYRDEHLVRSFACGEDLSSAPLSGG
jgi:hypothetical protein